MTLANLAIDYKDTLVLNRTEACCPQFDRSAWDYIQHDWHNKLFLKFSALGISTPFPWAYDKAVDKMLKKAKEYGAIPRNGNPLLLARKDSTFKSEFFMEASKEIPNQETVRLTGTFISRVFDEPKIPTCIRGLDGYVTSLGKKATNYYFHYPYCPSCARTHGHPYIVAIAKTKAIDPYLQAHLRYA